MEEAQITWTMTGGQANPIDRSGLCLLSLDGGGVRGLSSLYILRGVMKLLNHERKEKGLPLVKPCEIFDLIGGTSTGGLIAIMLGRLEMDVDECITAYSDLMESVFNERLRRMSVGFHGRIEPKFDSNKLKEAIETVVHRAGAATTDLFNDGQDRGCKVFVCTTAKDLYGITRLRSYDLAQKPNLEATICEAALATSAATGFFTPVEIAGRTFVDGALGANNPVDQMEEEAADVWCPVTGELKPLVKCFISIGTGNPGKKAIEDNIFKFLSKSLVQITTETEETGKKFIGRWRQQYDSKRYFRFNVEQGLQAVGLAEFTERGTIMTATEQYLDDQARVSQVRDCVLNLKQKQNRTDSAFRASVEAHHRRVILREHEGLDSPRHIIPFLQNRRFVGRTDILERVRKELFDDEGHRKVALVGLGGVGKTQVALQVAYWTKENKPGWSVFWMPALSCASFQQTSVQLLDKLRVPRVDTDDPGQVLAQYLSSIKSGNWLLVVDNADDGEVILGTAGETDGLRRYLPQADRGRILFTTRSQRIATGLAGPGVVQVTAMTVNEARTHFGKALINKDLLGDDRVVLELLNHLTLLPLAITQAAAYLNETTESIGEYLRLLRNTEEDLVELLATAFTDDTRYPCMPNAVATTWMVSFEHIRKDSDAANLLFFLAYMEPRAISRSMLPLAGSEQRLTRAIGVLCGYSFLSRRDNGAAFDMHRLVQVVSRAWIETRGESKQKKQAALDHLATIFNTDSWDSRNSWRSNLPHVLQALQGGRGDGGWGPPECKLGFWAGRCLVQEGRRREAVELLERVVAVRARTHSEDHPDRLAAQYTLALAFEADGQVKKAGVLLERVKAVHEVTLLEDHPDRLASQLALARVYRAKGQASKAVELLEHVVGVQKRAPSKDHSNRLVSHHELALAYRANGQVKKAVELLEHVKAVHEKTLLEDHPDRLASQHALALAYQANGQAKAALKLLEPVLEIHLRTLPEDHSNRLASQHALAIAYEACGQRKKAMELLDHVVAVHGKTLSEDHPDRLASQHALAGMYQVNGQVTQAIELLEPIVAIKERLLLEDHPDRLASQHELAGAYLANGQVKKAVRLLKHVVAVRERTLSEDHPDRLGSQHELARAYQDNRQVPEAVQLLEHVVAVRERTLLEYHPDRLASQHVLARAYQVNGQISKAVGLFEHVVEVRGRTLAEDHTSRLASQYALAGAYWANRQVKQAVELLEHLVAVEARMLSAQHVPGTTGTCEHSSG